MITTHAGTITITITITITQPNPTQPNPTQPNPTRPNPTQPNTLHNTVIPDQPLYRRNQLKPEPPRV
jgi:hypothetical protein